MNFKHLGSNYCGAKCFVRPGGCMKVYIGQKMLVMTGIWGDGPYPEQWPLPVIFPPGQIDV